MVIIAWTSSVFERGGEILKSTRFRPQYPTFFKYGSGIRGSSRKQVQIASRDSMASQTGMRMRSSREGVCGSNAVQFQSYDGSSYCTALIENCCTVLSPANWEIPVWSDDGAGNSLKAEPMSTTKTIEADRPWWRQNRWKVCGKQFCRTGSSQFRNSLVNSPRCFARNCLAVAEKLFHNGSKVHTAVTSSWGKLYDTGIQTLVHRDDKCLNDGGDYVEK